ncbi:DUF4328 domain-containing protein [Pseudonocardia sp. GCM10023141]|uniref:DUF4328 domain-containing protein n=1 Tax=Pseudonocardia sp. GCM10023141 TaxID=3252653 RepID=UPI00360C438D
MTCPRCGMRAVPSGGPFCPHCGRYLATLRWVAEPPPSATPPVPAPIRVPYTGAPRYRFIPRWGFTPGPWVADAEPEPAGRSPLQAARSLLATVVPLLWATTAVTFIAGGAEVWRYILLLLSRDGALSAGVVAASDALVSAAGTIAPVLGGLAGLLIVIWTVRASRAAAADAAVRPARRVRSIVLGWLVPGWNLVMAGSVLAEIEHTALRRAPRQRPRPSRLLLAWWALWAVGGVLAAVVVLWSLRTGVQARADGVVLHAVLDLVASATAAVTALLLVRLTNLLGPARAVRRELLVRIAAPAA